MVVSLMAFGTTQLPHSVGRSPPFLRLLECVVFPDTKENRWRNRFLPSSLDFPSQMKLRHFARMIMLVLDTHRDKSAQVMFLLLQIPPLFKFKLFAESSCEISFKKDLGRPGARRADAILAGFGWAKESFDHHTKGAGLQK
jgi:hypothetical protein